MSRKKVLRLCGLAVVVVMSCASYFGCRWALCVDSADKSGSAIILLGGDAAERTWRALELFNAGQYAAIYISGDGPEECMSRRLQLAGVPREKLIVERQSRSTKQNAQFTLPLLREHGVKRAVIVTSWFHTRRALACFRHYGKDIGFATAPAFPGPSLKKRPAIDDVLLVYREYAKLLGYWACYGISPF